MKKIILVEYNVEGLIIRETEETVTVVISSLYNIEGPDLQITVPRNQVRLCE